MKLWRCFHAFVGPQNHETWRFFLPKRYGINDITSKNEGYGGFPWNHIQQTKQEPFQISQKMKFSLHIFNFQLYQNRGNGDRGLDELPTQNNATPPPPHTHTFCRDLYHESHPECCYGLIVSIRMESTQSICGQPQTVMLPDSLALRPLERKVKHTETHTKWVPFFMIFLADSKCDFFWAFRTLA